MKYVLLSAAWLIWGALPLFALSDADPISGHWNVRGGPNGSDLNDVTMDLKFDGKSITGTAVGQRPGVVKAGSFDPATGALKLEIAVEGNQDAFVFEGTLVESEATGRLTVGNQKGVFKMTRSGQPSDNRAAVAALRRDFDEVSGNVAKSAELLPADKYTSHPTESVRTVGQLIAHVADGYNYSCSRAAGQSVKWSDAIEKGDTSKAAITQKLSQALEVCKRAYSEPGEAGALIDNLAHTNLHYGNIITYLRLLGLTPPSSGN